MPDDSHGDRILLALRGVTKRYGGVHALTGVDFSLRAGEIHALLGENGAGKSTLINILGGLVRPDAGTVEVDGQRVEIRHVADADRLGIRVIHQELSLAPNLSVAENLFLGREPRRFGLLDQRRMLDEAEKLVASLGLPEIGSPDALVATLSTAQQQMVEIAAGTGRALAGLDPGRADVFPLGGRNRGALRHTLPAPRARRGHHLHLAPARRSATDCRSHHRASRRQERRHADRLGA